LALAKFNDTLKIMPIYRKWKWLFGFWKQSSPTNYLQSCTGGCYDGLEEDYINLNQVQNQL
jgi:hypothetical protein